MLSSLMRPNPARKPLPPGDPRLVRLYRFQFFAYTVRHAVGVAFFAFLAWQSFALREPFWGAAIVLFGAVYTVFVGMNLHKLFRAWRKNAAIEREKGQRECK